MLTKLKNLFAPPVTPPTPCPVPATQTARLQDCKTAQALDGAKLNLGCGHDYRPGYVNVDRNTSHKVDMVADVTWLKDVPDQCCCEIVAQDVLEHIPRARGATALLEWNRVLRPDARLSVRVPSLVHLLTLFTHAERQAIAQQKQLIQCLYGTQGYDGDFHLNGFTEISLHHDFAEAGFAVEQLRVVDEWLFDVDARKVRHMAPDPLLREASDEKFISAAFQKLLGRSPDEQGARYYLGVLGQGIAREAVLESLRASEEHQAYVQRAG